MAEQSRDVFVPFLIEPQLVTPVAARAAGPAASKPRVEEPTNWYLQIAGRLKPGATIEQVKGNLAGPFQQAARGGMESYMAGLTDEQRKLSRNQREGDAVPELLVAARRARHLRSRSHLVAIGVRPQRRRRPAAVDRVRERREPAAVARGGALSRSVGAAVDGRVAAPAGAAAADREPAALRHRRRAWHRARLLEQEAAAVRAEHGDRLAGAGVRGRHQHADRTDLRPDPGAARDAGRSRERDEGEQPQRRRRRARG